MMYSINRKYVRLSGIYGKVKIKKRKAKMNLILLILVPCVVLLCGVKLAKDHAYEQMDITILSIFTTIFCALNTLQKLRLAIEGTKIIQVDRIAFIPVSLIWFGAAVLHAYIFIKGIKWRKE